MPRACGNVSREDWRAGRVSFDETVSRFERDLLREALERCQWNQTRAAALLGLNRDQIRYRIEKFGLSKAELTDH